MAKSIPTKQALNSTTSANPRAVIGGNKPPVDADTKAHDQATDLAKIAFAEYDDAQRKGRDGTSAQRMAYAVLLIRKPDHKSWKDYMNKPVVGGGSSARSTLQGDMLAAFIPDGKPVFSEDTKDNPTEDELAKDAEYKRHKALVIRGCDLAAVLVWRKVSMDRYNKDTGMWSVDTVHYFADGYKPVDKATSVPMDGRMIWALKQDSNKQGPGVQKKSISVNTLVAFLPKADRQQPEPKQKDDQPKAQVRETIADNLNFATRNLMPRGASVNNGEHRTTRKQLEESGDWSAIQSFIKLYNELIGQDWFNDVPGAKPAIRAQQAPIAA